MIVDNLEFHIKRNGDASATGVKNLSNSMKSLEKATKQATTIMDKFLASLKRIAVYRVLRTIIKEIGKAFEEGLKNAYAFSQTINGQLAQTLDTITSLGMQMKNQLGSALGELLINISPIIEAVENLIIRIADAMSRLFAVLGGRSTYQKAIASTEKWADATASGAKAAKEWKNQLMGFDEINRLEAPSDTGGGGGSNSANGIGNWEMADANMEWARQLREITMDWLSKVNFEPIINAWGRLKDAVSGFISLVDKGLRWAYINVLLPVAQWGIEELAPSTVNMLASAVEMLNTAIEKLSPVFIKFFEEYLKPFAIFVGEELIKALDWLAEKYDSIKAKIEDADSFTKFWDSLELGERVVVALTAVLGLFLLSLLPINGVLAAIAVVGAIVYKNWDELKAAATALGEKIKEAFDKIKQAAEHTWEKIKDVGGMLYDTLYTILTPIRLVCDGLVAIFNWAKTAVLQLNELFKFSNKRALEIEADGSIYLQGFASGGFPAEGQLFMARENGAGAELVGTANGRTAVASNDDIYRGIHDGVEDANSGVISAVYAVGMQIVNAMAENSSNGGTDWNAVARQVTRYQRMQNASANL